MKTRDLIIIGTIIGIIASLWVILYTELLGESATFGQCTISASGNNEGYSSTSPLYENQCKQSCANAGNIEVNEIRTVSCRFQTVSGWLGFIS